MLLLCSRSLRSLPAFLLAGLIAASGLGCASKLRTVGPELLPFEEGTTLAEIDKKAFRLRIETPDDQRRFIFPKNIQKQFTPDLPVMPPTVLADEETSRSIVFIIAEPEWVTPKGFHEDRRRSKPHRGIGVGSSREEEIGFTIRERLYRYLLRHYPHPVRVRYAWRESDQLIQNYRVVTVETRVTDIKRGDAWLRYLLGYGLGQSRIQIQGELFEGADRRKIGDFEIRRGHGGFSQSGLNTDVLRDDYALKYATEAAIRILAEEISERLPGTIIVPQADR